MDGRRASDIEGPPMRCDSISGKLSRFCAHCGAVYAVLVAASCSDSGERSSRTESEAAAPTVRGAVDGGWPGGAAWRLEEDLTLGTAGDGGPEEFGAVRAVSADSRGRIYVLDGIYEEIRVFDASGSFLHTVGRKGAGAGELSFAMGMMFGEGDTLWVVDTQAGRYSVFAPDGSFVTSHPRRISSGNVDATTLLSDGRILDWNMAFPDGRFGQRIVYWPVIFTPGSVRFDSLPPIVHRQEMMPDGRMPQPFFGGEVVLAADGNGGGIWVAETRRYEVYRRTLEGDTTLTIGLAATPARVGQAEREYVKTAFGNTNLSRYLDELPETKQIVHRICPDRDGQVFVFPATSDAPAGTVVDVFGDGGEYFGRMDLPTPAAPISRRPTLIAHAAEDYLLVVHEDELGVPHVSRLRIIRGE